MMPDSESAQNFGTVLFATTQLLHVLRLAGHIWSQGGHRSNLMPDLELVQNSGCYNPVKTCFATSWSQLVTAGHRSNHMPDLEPVQNFGTVKCATTQLLMFG